MDSQSTRDLLVRGVAAAKAGEEREARFFLEWLLRLDPPLHDRNEALYWLSKVSKDPVEKRSHLENILAYDLGDARARRELAILNGKLNEADIIDPDRLQQTAPGEPAQAGAQRFVCPNCGGRMTFRPDGQSLTCEYCDSKQTLKKEDHQHADEQDFIVAMATAKGHLHPVTSKALTCEACGIHFVLPPERVTLTCPYCQSNYVVSNVKSLEYMQPDGIIPFRVNELKARYALRAWLEQDPPEERPRVAPGRGLYIPVWVFDIGGQSEWRCMVEQNKTRVVHRNSRPVQYHDIPILATRRFPPELTPALQSYDLRKIVRYEHGYLANWLAETYQVNVGDASLHARKIALENEQKTIPDMITESFSDLIVSSAAMLVEAYQLVLLPVWLTHYMVESKRYDVMINGQNGHVYGERPERGLVKWLGKLFGR